MLVQKAEIKNDLRVLKAALANKSSSYNCDCFIFHENKIFTISEHLIISCKNPYGIGGNFNGKDLLKIVDSMGDEFEISCAERKLVLKSKGIRGSVTGVLIDSDPYIMIERLGKKSFKEIPESFMEGLHLCAESSSKDIRDCELACVVIKPGVIESTDNIRASAFYTKFDPGKTAIIFSSFAKKIPSTCTKVSVGPNYIHFKDGKFVYSIPYVEADLPDIEAVISSWIPKSREKIPFPNELIMVAKELEFFCGGNTDYEKTVKVEFNDKFIKCTARKEGASLTKKIKNNSDFVGTFLINPVLLLSILKDKHEVFIHDNKIFFMKKDFIHVIGM